MNNNSHDIPVRYLTGVGPKLADVLSKVGIFNVKDLVYYFPREYEDRRNICPISGIRTGEEVLIQGKVMSVTRQRTKRNFIIIKGVISDKSGSVGVVWYNQPFLLKILKKGTQLLLKGKAEYNSYSREILFVPRYYEIKNSDENLPVVPIYPLTQGLFQKKLRSMIKTALEKYASDIIDPLPEVVRNKYKLADLRTSLVKLHYPKDISEAQSSKRRVLFDEMLTFHLGILIRRKLFKEKLKGVTLKINKGIADDYVRSQTFELTDSQNKAISDIGSDLSGGYIMNRLLQGDVGCGKTIVAIYAMLMAIQNGYQAALMAPTEILANQHYLKIKGSLDNLGVITRLLTGSEKAKEKNKIYEEIKSGKPLIIVGTHALIEEGVEFGNLGMAVIDEQHRFGVVQRSRLKSKGNNPHLLVMTATPIPRSLALTVYGDLDRTVINEMPKGRIPIITRFVGENETLKMHDFIRKEVNKGRQVYIVYPLVEESEVMDLKAVKTEHIKLKERFPEFNIGLMHGRMKGEEKDEVMKDFKDGKINILVSTTVIEVGIDVPNATIMVIEHAERFGLSQLHQLRGRVGRGSERSYCFLVGDPKSEITRSRLKALLDSNDGFYIAEADLKIRGPGEVLGTRQSGISLLGNLPNFRVADIINDEDLLRITRAAAEGLISQDPNLDNPENVLLKREIFNKYGNTLELGALD